MKSRWIGLVVFLLFTGIFFSFSPKSVPDLVGSSTWGEDDEAAPSGEAQRCPSPGVFAGAHGFAHFGGDPCCAQSLGHTPLAIAAPQ